MAFLCPVRIRRGKKKKSGSGDEMKELRNASFTMGRITGSSSIETLVRVGIEKENGLSPESKMLVMHDFLPFVDDELRVSRGEVIFWGNILLMNIDYGVYEVVNILYRENDWVYVIAEESRMEGFIPHSYCTPYNSHLGELALNNVKKKLPRDRQNIPSCDHEVDAKEDKIIFKKGDATDNESFGKKDGEKHVNNGSSQGSLHSASSQHDVQPFFKDPCGRFIVLYTFIARDENDVSVERGEFVTVLNREDPEWYWIIRSDAQEGFVPSTFIYPADVVNGHLNQISGMASSEVAEKESTIPAQVSPPAAMANEDIHYHGTELVMLYDYKAQAPDDLNVRRGDWVYADLNNQTIDGWLWAFAPKTRKYGFIPKAYARPPAMTSL